MKELSENVTSVYIHSVNRIVLGRAESLTAGLAVAWGNFCVQTTAKRGRLLQGLHS